MSYALESKKRKFNRVLDSISKPLTSNSSKTINKDPVATARERLAAPPSIKKVRAGDGLNGLTSETRISKIVRASSSSLNIRPNFVPWDRERFLERLETFRPVTRWSPKPAPINEVEWAKRGWSCTDYMRVACVGGCGASVVVKLPDEVDDFDELDSDKVRERKEVRAKVVEEYTRVIVEGHNENCPWRNKACDATIHRLALTNPDVAIDGLQKRYIKVADMKSQLPSEETIELPGDLKLDEVIKILPPRFSQRQGAITDSGKTAALRDASQEDIQALEDENSQQQIDETAFALAFCGWDVFKDGSSGLLECRACFRRLGLWLYKPKDNGQSAIYNKLSIADEHMEYCPWVNGKAQSGSGKASEKPEDLYNGWELLAHSIKAKHRRRVRSAATPDNLPRDSDTSSVDFTAVDEEAQKIKDREWWHKLRRVREALHVRGHRKTTSGNK